MKNALFHIAPTSNIFINQKEWSQYTDDEMRRFQEDVFLHYRKHGFPHFRTDLNFRNGELDKAKDFNFLSCIDYKEKTIKQTMHGLALCWSYHPHHYDVQCNELGTVFDLFNNDTKLKKAIKKRIEFGSNMSDNGLKKMMKIFSGVQCVSNFRPTASAALYKLLCPKGGVAYDMSSGYGGRCLGASLAEVKYFGVEPCFDTFTGLQKMIDELGLDAEVKQTGSEIGGWLEPNSVDCCFTSPPYFDCEKYSDEPTQSHLKYPTKDGWLNGYMKDTLIECKRVLKDDGVIAINIQNTKKYQNLVKDVIHLCKDIDLHYFDEWKLQLSKLPYKQPTGSRQKTKVGFKTEPILIFKPKNSRFKIFDVLDERMSLFDDLESSQIVSVKE